MVRIYTTRFKLLDKFAVTVEAIDRAVFGKARCTDIDIAVIRVYFHQVNTRFSQLLRHVSQEIRFVQCTRFYVITGECIGCFIRFGAPVRIAVDHINNSIVFAKMCSVCNRWQYRIKLS